jgi:hypothetical protein
VYQSKKRGQGSGAMYAVENLDIEQGLNLARVMQQPYVNGRKIIRYYSKRTNKSAVISIIDPAYLLAGNQVSERRDSHACSRLYCTDSKVRAQCAHLFAIAAGPVPIFTFDMKNAPPTVHKACN